MNEHDVVLYGNDAADLTHCVVPFIASAIQDSGAAVVIAATEHERAFRSGLAAVAVDTESAIVRERLIFLNASEIVKGLFVDGRIERARFERLVGHAIRKLAKRYTVHAYGELVGILCAMGHPDAAARLEQLWNELLREVNLRLLCGYPIDIVKTGFHPNEMEVILSTHNGLVSATPDFASALNARIESALGSVRASAIRGLIEAKYRPGWTTLWEPDSAPIIDEAKAV